MLFKSPTLLLCGTGSKQIFPYIQHWTSGIWELQAYLHTFYGDHRAEVAGRKVEATGWMEDKPRMQETDLKYQQERRWLKPSRSIHAKRRCCRCLHPHSAAVISAWFLETRTKNTSTETSQAPEITGPCMWPRAVLPLPGEHVNFPPPPDAILWRIRSKKLLREDRCYLI